MESAVSNLILIGDVQAQGGGGTERAEHSSDADSANTKGEVKSRPATRLRGPSASWVAVSFLSFPQSGVTFVCEEANCLAPRGDLESVASDS